MIELPKELQRALLKCHDNPETAFECYFDWYQDAWLMHDDLWTALSTIPRLIREMMVTHQAWGLMSGGGPDAYYFRLDRRFDEEVRLGLEALNCSESIAPLIRGRDIHELPEHEAHSLQDNLDVYTQLISLEELEAKIGNFLLLAVKTK